jgi:hypothetical protein
MFEIWNSEAGNSRSPVARIALVPAPRAQFGQRRHRLVDRVARLFRIGDVALDARAR